MQEARALGRTHENIARLLGLANVAGGALVFEWLPFTAETLIIDAPERKVLLQEKVQLLIGAAAGLAHLHRLGVVHERVAPWNILTSVDCSRVKLAGSPRNAKVSDRRISTF